MGYRLRGNVEKGKRGSSIGYRGIVAQLPVVSWESPVVDRWSGSFEHRKRRLRMKKKN